MAELQRVELLAEQAEVLAEQGGLLAEQAVLLAEQEGLLAEQAGLLAEQAGLLAKQAEAGEAENRQTVRRSGRDCPFALQQQRARQRGLRYPSWIHRLHYRGGSYLIFGWVYEKDPSVVAGCAFGRSDRMV